MSKAENEGRMPDPYKVLGLGNEGNLGIPVTHLKEAWELTYLQETMTETAKGQHVFQLQKDGGRERWHHSLQKLLRAMMRKSM